MADSSIGATCARTNTKTSRRAILGAMALAPVAALPAVAALPVDTAVWDATMRKYLLAVRMHDGEANYVSFMALMHMAAPNLQALRWKLEQTFMADGDNADWYEPISKVLRNDIATLLPAGGAA